MKYQIKIITGFRKDQAYTVDAEEAHKAYYLFLNPEKRGVFSNGVALIGSDIRGIEPDYNATMGWNPLHVMDAEDMAEVKGRGVGRKLRSFLIAGREVAMLGDEKKLSLPLSDVAKGLPKFQVTEEVKQLAKKMSV